MELRKKIAAVIYVVDFNCVKLANLELFSQNSLLFTVPGKNKPKKTFCLHEQFREQG
jgi:formate/nitrite transporter FocA (FNT family)